ncbi:MAG: fasciclin domain-containing protein [Reichenbachiella sp.]|uniref:fasciclin domain-containing protein n=1 Tax=Reichenbachiella sp. TaxID=2184521 RepID=UPI0029668221|nr:fasciclin domain-containing protein [Reichenbachiella sp.]MDW3211291.1 fasciclin domain-containing protein [Reichenbachiella sp.]
MKNTFLLSFLLLFSVSLVMVSCDDDDNNMDGDDSSNDIVAVLQANDFNILAAAATQAGLIETLQGDGPFTVFAPTDAAFAQLLIDLGVDGLGDISNLDLVEVLTYHVVAAEVYSADVADGDVTTVNGADITLATSDGITVNGVSVVSPFDLAASNGVVHAIDEVLVPEGFELSPTKDIVATAVASGYSSLAAALTRADLISALQADGPFTVFAPTDAAFATLLTTIGQESIDDVPVDVLVEILKYHVVSGEVPSSAVTAGNVATLQGDEITLATEGGITVNGAKVVSPFDVETTNGIIHTIDAVLVPEDVLAFVGTVLEPAYFNKNFTTLITAAVKADLVTTILDAEALTIFAPTNEAFTASGIDLDAATSAAVADILKYHVVGSKVLSSGIPANAETLQGDDIYFSLVDAGNFINGSAEITTVDVESGTGVVHIIDEVLEPAAGTIVDVTSALADDGSFTSLLAALTRTAGEGSPQDLVAVLNGAGPYTVFAPTDAAFTELLDSNESWTTLNDIPIATLVDVLKYHVVSGRVYDVDLAGALTANKVASVEGTDLTFDLTELTINTSANITGTNVHATNGVIHVIDEVLLIP